MTDGIAIEKDHNASERLNVQGPKFRKRIPSFKKNKIKEHFLPIN